MKDDVARMVAALHDVVEDSGYTLEDLQRRGFSSEVVDAVDALTRLRNEPYNVFLRRGATNPIARKVKLADLQDNLDIRCLNSLTAADLERLRRYHEAWKMLHEANSRPARRDPANKPS